jgi:hypothetical protein
LKTIDNLHAKIAPRRQTVAKQFARAPSNVRTRGVDTFFYRGGGGGRGRQGLGRERKGGGAGGTSLENLHAMVVGVSHHNAPVAVNGNAAIRVLQLSVA